MPLIPSNFSWRQTLVAAASLSANDASEVRWFRHKTDELLADLGFTRARN